MSMKHNNITRAIIKANRNKPTTCIEDDNDKLRDIVDQFEIGNAAENYNYDSPTTNSMSNNLKHDKSLLA